MLVFIQLIYRARAGLLSGRSESLLGQFEAGSVESKRKKEVYFCTKLAPFPWRIGSIDNCYLLLPIMVCKFSRNSNLEGLFGMLITR